MSNELLVKVYKVGFGDCIYVQIPDDGDVFTMLIDCGTSGSADPLEDAVDDIRKMLPTLNGAERRLDLLVVTHPHADHIKGFDPRWFKKIKIARIWLPVFMNPMHPEAKRIHAFQHMAERSALDLMNRGGLALASGARSLLERSAWNLNNAGALDALREGLARDSGIRPDYPLFVARDLANRQKKAERTKYALDFEEGVTRFRGFREPDTCLRVLAPEWDIDKWYLGRDLFDAISFADPHVFGSSASKAESAGSACADAAAVSLDDGPRNISAHDFRLLRSRLVYSALSFSDTDNSLKNNTSVVLLLEWRGRRLLFTGDAEWQDAEVKQDHRNSTWAVMLNDSDISSVLLQTLDLLKVAHHGSHNGTPFRDDGQEHILKRMLSADRTNIVVSTVAGVHGEKYPVPYPQLMEILGGLACNKRRYLSSPVDDAGTLDLSKVDQPQRTDLEEPAAGETVPCIKVTMPGVTPP